MLKLHSIALTFVMFWCAGELLARNIEVERSGTYPKSPTEMLEILRDHGNTCHSGCKYRMKELRETVVLDTDESHDLLWQRLTGIKETRQFVKSTIAFEGDVATLRSYYPEPSELDQLAESHGLEHKSIFKTMSIQWTLTPQEGGQTLAHVYMQVDHNLTAPGDPLVKASINNSLKTMLHNFTVED